MAPLKSTRRVPPNFDVFATQEGGVTVVGPDERLWQARSQQPVLMGVGKGAITNGEPIEPPSAHRGKLLVGSDRKLYLSEGDRWVPATDNDPNKSYGFRVPTQRQPYQRLDADTVDDENLMAVLSTFVQSYASYRRADAIPVYYDGTEFIMATGGDEVIIRTPESFRRGLLNARGLEGIIFIPQEDYLEDLLISESDLENDLVRHPDTDKREWMDMNVDDTGKHRVTKRQIAGPTMTASKCYQSAWDAAVFEITDMFTADPGDTFERRRQILDDMYRSKTASFKQIRLAPTRLIESKEMIVSMYENTPHNAYLVIQDPNEVYTNPVDPHAKDSRVERVRKTSKPTERAAPLVGWMCDGGGKLVGLVVEGNGESKSAIVVRPSNLWTNQPEMMTTYDVDAKKNAIVRSINNSYSGNQPGKGTRCPAAIAKKLADGFLEDLAHDTKSNDGMLDDTPDYAVDKRMKAIEDVRNDLTPVLNNLRGVKDADERFSGFPINMDLILSVQNAVDQIMPVPILPDVIAMRILALQVLIKKAPAPQYFTGKSLEMLKAPVEVAMDDGKTYSVPIPIWHMNDAEANTPADKIAALMEQGVHAVTLHEELRVHSFENPFFAALRRVGVWDALVAGEVDHQQINKKRIDKDGARSNKLGLWTYHQGSDKIDKIQLTALDADALLPAAKEWEFHHGGIKGSFWTDIGRDESNFGHIGTEMALNLRRLVLMLMFVHEAPECVFTKQDNGKTRAQGQGMYGGRNLLAWNEGQQTNYQRSFPYGALIGYKTQKGDAGKKEVDKFVMTKITIV
jgi:hypothetical protein